MGSLGRIRRRRWWLCWRLEPWALANGLWLIPGLIGSGPKVLRGNLKIVIFSLETLSLLGGTQWGWGALRVGQECSRARRLREN